MATDERFDELLDELLQTLNAYGQGRISEHERKVGVVDFLDKMNELDLDAYRPGV